VDHGPAWVQTRAKMGRAAHDADSLGANTRQAVGNSVFEDIQALLDDAGGDIARIERTLTDGYAKALSLEAERWRLEKQIGEVAASIARGEEARKARELLSLAKRLEASDCDLTRLRGLLASLRARADVVRAAAV
jgi:hypothetical protein